MCSRCVRNEARKGFPVIIGFGSVLVLVMECAYNLESVGGGL